MPILYVLQRASFPGNWPSPGNLPFPGSGSYPGSEPCPGTDGRWTFGDGYILTTAISADDYRAPIPDNDDDKDKDLTDSVDIQLEQGIFIYLCSPVRTRLRAGVNDLSGVGWGGGGNDPDKDDADG